MKKNNSAGFTLIELLMVMAIISALLAMAIPQYGKYRARAFDTRARLDLHNIAAAEEAYFFDHEQYLSCENQSCLALPGIAALSKGVKLSVAAAPADFTAEAHHELGSGKSFTWNSATGGMVE